LSNHQFCHNLATIKERSQLPTLKY